MNLAEPLWLLGLLPWAVLTVWLLFRRQSTTSVPFLQFWSFSPITSARRPSLGAPPLSVIFLLLAIALAVLGAARPQIISRSPALPVVLKPEAHIVYLAAADKPHAQVMLKISTHHYDRPAVVVRISTGGQHVEQSIPIEENAIKTTFVDLPNLAASVTASIDDQPPVTIARRGNRLRLSSDAHVPPTLQRLIDLYGRQRSTDGKEAEITVSSSLEEGRRGIILASSSSADPTPLTVMDDPLTRDVDWRNLSGGCAVSEGWVPLVFHGRSVMVARRTVPTQQVLVSVTTEEWPAMASFVVFWSNTLNWLAGGDGTFETVSLTPSPVTSGEGGGEGDFEEEKSSDFQNHPHPNPLPVYREGGPENIIDLAPSVFLASLALLLLACLFVSHRAFPYTVSHGHDSKAANPHR